ncbi:hypothetical protein AIOL_002121 [Candidatus Rhodobacter oscarellae]|uniref:DUF6314 domain-containing protein n=1 Tax=Candidatus Rhodobacter oscarellae TaxID=1675527 RepID=A0A0J9E343_9RHOB|nr:DUF6314 family protein [Candidatus Rhodobacter lobularis]KMW57160.1 hypothetical protein AIOL_002121 [Candidatus Rhodobacter lobularis]
MRLAEFEGRWRIDREIDDHLTGQKGRFEGAALFAPVADGLLYSENGVLSLGGQEMRAERRYLWRESGQGAQLLFADGRPFHFVDLTIPQPEASHDCPPDWYEVAYDFTAWPNWHATWHVTGPRKDYTMVSAFSRAGPLPK